MSATYTAEFADGTRATMTIGQHGCVIGWDPGPPSLRGRARADFITAYRTWRDTCLSDYAGRTGVTVAVLEL